VYVTSTINWGLNINEGIHLSEIDIKTGKLLTRPKNIWIGTGGRYPEGPHIYKKDGFYYLMIAEGGTEFGHKETIARSKYIDGPYVSNPANPILTHINMNAETSPIQGVGHGDLVQTQDSSWFIVAHAFRQFNGHQILGRETFLAPVRWDKNAWPVVNGNGTVSYDMETTFLPAIITENAYYSKDEFTETKLGLEWNYLNNPIEVNYSLSQRKGYLRLIGNDSTLSRLPSVTFIGRRQQHFDFIATTNIDFVPKSNNEEAGITLFKDAANHFDLTIKSLGNRRMIALNYNIGLIHHIEKEIPLQNGTVILSVTGTQEYYQFAFSQNGQPFVKMGEADTRYLSSVTVGGFSGVYIGLYATGNGQISRSPADFDWFMYKPN